MTNRKILNVFSVFNPISNYWIGLIFALMFLDSPSLLAQTITNTGFAKIDNSNQVSSSNVLANPALTPTPTTPVTPSTSPPGSSAIIPSNAVVISTTNRTSENTPLILVKSGDRAAAEPGETIVYRLTLRQNNNTNTDNIIIRDQLPLGINFLPDSVQVALEEKGTLTQQNSFTVSTENRTIQFQFPTLKPGQTLVIIYAAIVTPDAVRGGGRNTAQEARSNLATFLVRIREGILSDCGTIIGRVFIDQNFDGEQQTGEPGVPHAVIFLQDGNRITTDENGLFSIANILAGYYNGTLDLTSIPGYKIAPNHYFIERNSQSRLVRLEPGGLVRMNFAVTPVSSPSEPSP